MKTPRNRGRTSATEPASVRPPLAAVLPRSAASAAAHFRPARALADAAQLWRMLRFMDSKAILQGARWLADQLRDAGLDNVQVIEFPADGRTLIGGWLMPIPWTVRDAVLRAGSAGRDGVAVDPDRAVAWVRHLLRVGHARLRPVLEPSTLRRAFRAGESLVSLGDHGACPCPHCRHVRTHDSPVERRHGRVRNERRGVPLPAAGGDRAGRPDAGQGHHA